MKKTCLSLTLNICQFLASTKQIQAKLVINEVLPNPPSGCSEWVEIFNPDNQTVNLADWKLEDQLSSPTTIFSFTDQIIDPNQYLVVQLPSAKLNNDKDGVTLKDQSDNQIDMMSYVSSVNNMSLAREDGGIFTVATPSPGEQNFSHPTPAPSPSPEIPTTPTPNPMSSPSTLPSPSPSLTPSPSPTIFAAANLQLSEIYACPNSGENEWIEIYNLSNQSGTLTNWKLRDDSDNTKTFNLTINGHSLAIIEWSGSLLNNDGDSITLEDLSGNRSFTISFPECTKGQSFIYHDNAWRPTSTPTKNTSNLYSSNPSPSPSPSLSPTPTPTATQSDSELNYSNNQLEANLASSEFSDSYNQDSEYDLALPDLEIQTPLATEAGQILGQSTDATPAAQLIPAPPNKTGVMSLLGTSAAMIGGSCWAMMSTKRKDDSLI